MLLLAVALALQQSSPLPAIAATLADDRAVRAIILPPADSAQRRSIAKQIGATRKADTLSLSAKKPRGFVATVFKYQTGGDSGHAIILLQDDHFYPRPLSSQLILTVRRVDGVWKVVDRRDGGVS